MLGLDKPSQVVRMLFGREKDVVMKMGIDCVCNPETDTGTSFSG